MAVTAFVLQVGLSSPLSAGWRQNAFVATQHSTWRGGGFRHGRCCDATTRTEGRSQRLPLSPQRRARLTTVLAALDEDQPRAVGTPSKVSDPAGETPQREEPLTDEEEDKDPDILANHMLHEPPPEAVYDPEAYAVGPHQKWRRGDTAGCHDPLHALWRLEAEEIIRRAVSEVGGRVLDITWSLTKVMVTLDEESLEEVEHLIPPRQMGPQVVVLDGSETAQWFDPEDPEPEDDFGQYRGDLELIPEAAEEAAALKQKAEAGDEEVRHRLDVVDERYEADAKKYEEELKRREQRARTTPPRPRHWPVKRAKFIKLLERCKSNKDFTELLRRRPLMVFPDKWVYQGERWKGERLGDDKEDEEEEEEDKDGISRAERENLERDYERLAKLFDSGEDVFDLEEDDAAAADDDVNDNVLPSEVMMQADDTLHHNVLQVLDEIALTNGWSRHKLEAVQALAEDYIPTGAYRADMTITKRGKRTGDYYGAMEEAKELERLQAQAARQRQEVIAQTMNWKKQQEEEEDDDDDDLDVELEDEEEEEDEEDLVDDEDDDDDDDDFEQDEVRKKAKKAKSAGMEEEEDDEEYDYSDVEADELDALAEEDTTDTPTKSKRKRGRPRKNDSDDDDEGEEEPVVNPKEVISGGYYDDGDSGATRDVIGSMTPSQFAQFYADDDEFKSAYGINPQKVEVVSRSILDALEAVEYRLEILNRHELLLLSPVISDALITQSDFNKHRNLPVIVETTDPFGSNRVLRGLLVDRNVMDVILNRKGRMVTIPHTFIKHVWATPIADERIDDEEFEDYDDNDDEDGQDSMAVGEEEEVAAS